MRLHPRIKLYFGGKRRRITPRSNKGHCFGRFIRRPSASIACQTDENDSGDYAKSETEESLRLPMTPQFRFVPV